MSRKKIKSPKPKKFKMPPHKPRHLLEAELQSEREAKKIVDTHKITDLIVNDVLDPKKIDDYKHVLSVAKGIGWSKHRLDKAIEKANVRQVVENEREIEDKPPEPLQPRGDSRDDKDEGKAEQKDE